MFQTTNQIFVYVYIYIYTYPIKSVCLKMFPKNSPLKWEHDNEPFDSDSRTLFSGESISSVYFEAYQCKINSYIFPINIQKNKETTYYL